MVAETERSKDMNYQTICEAKTKKAMQQAFKELLEEIAKKHGYKPEKYRLIQLSNIGYFAGYFNSKTMKRVQKWLGAYHPVFGGIIPTPKKAYETGKRLGSKT